MSGAKALGLFCAYQKNGYTAKCNRFSARLSLLFSKKSCKSVCDAFFHAKNLEFVRFFNFLAGMAGFEPTHARVKVTLAIDYPLFSNIIQCYIIACTARV